MTSRQQRWTRVGILTFTTTVLAIAALLALLAIRLANASQAASSVPPSPLIGHAAPDLTITVLNGTNGEQVRLADLRGHPVVVTFWASWCGPCQEETPVLEAAYQKYQRQGVVFVGVDYQDTPSAALTFLRQYGVTYPSGADTSNGNSAIAYGVTGPPETAFVDRSGKVVRKLIGMVDDRTLDQSIQSLLKP